MKQKYKVLDLFSGLGGFSLGLERTGHFETVAFCDNDKFSKAILDKHWKGIKVYDDVREITKEKFKEDGIEFPDIITGGFPCQPFSVAGKQKGTGDDRHLWPEMFRIIKAFKPRFVIGENVRGIVNIQDGVVFETVCTNLEDEGYEVQPFNIPAAAVGAPHRRERIWFIAVREEPMVNSDNIRFEQHNETTETTSGRGTSATSQSTSNVGNSEYNGSPTSEIRRGNEKINGGTEERQNNSFEFERTSRSEDNGNVSENVADTENGRGQPSQSERWQGTERGSIDSRGIEREGQDLGTNVENSNNNGLEGRLTETRNETITGKESSFNGSEDTDNSSRRSDGGGDQSKSRIDGAVQGLRDGNEEELTRTTRVRGVHERTNISVGTIRENKNQEDDNRTLVQTRQSGVQSSVGGGLELNQTSLDNNQIRQGDDNSSLNRMETRDKDNVADTHDEGLRTRIGGSDNDHETESRIGGADGEGGSSDVERNNSTSTEVKGMDVADTESIGSDVGRRSEHSETWNGQREIGGENSQDDANSNEEGLQGFRQSRNQLNKRFSLRSEGSEGEHGTVGQGWWSVEPNVGRVAHGVPGRVYRLKGLGNSIVPQIVEEIGKALIKATRES
jgi:DNA (cytosine-5)-methyltransferase 1